jgi:uncharacterized membrane protein (UPF0127 family)
MIKIPTYKKYLRVEIADTPSMLEKGLMFRKEMDTDAGMAFIFKNAQNLRFWGLNTYIPLDVAFVSPDRKIVKIEHISPLSTKTICSDTDCDIAIEANLGYFADNKIVIGSDVKIINDDYEKYIVFE